jgi:catechol 2,3-dioxygenase-like lactoylglutathione lyase family enzyme
MKREKAMTVTLEQVGIAVQDMEVSLRFYRLLGLPVPEGVEHEPHVELDLGGFRLAWDTVEMLEGVYDGWEPASGHRIELAFRCDSRDEVDATFNRMTDAGHRGHKAPWDAFWGQRYAIVEDPDGNLISLYA